MSIPNQPLLIVSVNRTSLPPRAVKSDRQSVEKQANKMPNDSNKYYFGAQ